MSLGTVQKLCLAVVLFTIQSSAASEYYDNLRGNVEYGPITALMDNLAHLTVKISDETSNRLQANVERTISEMTANIEMLVGNAMQEISTTIYQANAVITNNSDCNPSWNMAEFMDDINVQLTMCVQDIRHTMETFRADGLTAVANLQSFVQQFAQLPVLCQILSAASAPLNLSTFANGSNCFMQRVEAINRDMGQELNKATMLISRTRQLVSQSIDNANKCTSSVTAQAISDLDAALINCQ